MTLDALIKYIEQERNKIGFYHCGKEVSWNEMPLLTRKNDYPYHFIGEIDCFPFIIDYDKTTGEPYIKDLDKINKAIKKIKL
jgi:hypothetical protein